MFFVSFTGVCNDLIKKLYWKWPLTFTWTCWLLSLPQISLYSWNSCASLVQHETDSFIILIISVFLELSHICIWWSLSQFRDHRKYIVWNFQEYFFQYVSYTRWLWDLFSYLFLLILLCCFRPHNLISPPADKYRVIGIAILGQTICSLIRSSNRCLGWWCKKKYLR